MDERDDFIVDSEAPDLHAHAELTGWETVVFELADEEGDAE